MYFKNTHIPEKNRCEECIRLQLNQSGYVLYEIMSFMVPS